MRRFRQGAVGIFGDLLLLLPLLPRLLEWVLELRFVRVVLGMANLGQAVDFAIQHLENPGWLGNGWLQIAVIIIGLLFIFWDREKPGWLPSPEISAHQMIIGGFVIIVIGVVVLGIGLWRRPDITPPANANQAAPSPAPIPAPLPAAPAAPVVVDGSPIGPKTTMSMITRLGQPPVMDIKSPSPKGTKWAIVFYPTDQETRSLITSLLIMAGLDVTWTQAADRNLEPEAPDLVASDDKGITLHGNSALSKRLFEVLQPCLAVHHREKTPDNLQEWYGRAARDDRQVVWIEIGSGPVWTNDKRCLI